MKLEHPIILRPLLEATAALAACYAIGTAAWALRWLLPEPSTRESAMLLLVLCIALGGASARVAYLRGREDALREMLERLRAPEPPAA